MRLTNVQTPLLPCPYLSDIFIILLASLESLQCISTLGNTDGTQTGQINCDDG